MAVWPKVVTIVLLTAKFWDKVYNLMATDSILNVYLLPPIQSICLHLLTVAEQPRGMFQHDQREGGRPHGEECGFNW